MSIAEIDELPNSPDPAVDPPAVFSAKAAASVLAQKTMVPQLNTAIAGINAASADVATKWADVLNAADSVAEVPKWIAGTSYVEGARVWSSANGQTYRRLAPGGVSNTDPSEDAIGWRPVMDLGVGWKQTSVGNIATSQILDLNAANVLEYAPTVGGLSITLRDATKVKLGPAAQVISNKGEYELAVRDKAGDLLCVVGPGGFAVFTLIKNTTVAGEWSAAGHGVKYVLALKERLALGLVGGLSQVLAIRYGAIGIIKMTDTIAVFMSRNSATLYLQAFDFSTMQAGPAVSAAGLPTSLEHFTAGFAINASSGVVICANDGVTAAYYAVPFALVGTTITAGPLASKTLPISSLSFLRPASFQSCIAQLPNGLFAVQAPFAGSNPFSQGLLSLTVAGNTAAWGAIANVGPSTGATVPQVAGVYVVSGTQVVTLFIAGNNWYASLMGWNGATFVSQASVGANTTLATHLPITELQMASDEWWILTTTTGSPPLGVIRLKLTGANTFSVTYQTIAASAPNDYNYIAGYYNLNSHGFFQKIDATNAAYVSAGYASHGFYRMTWNGTTFVFAGTVAQSPTNSTMPERPPYVANPQTGFYAFVNRAWRIDNVDFFQGYSDSTLAMMRLDLASNTSVTTWYQPMPVYSPTWNSSSGTNEYEVAYRGNKVYCFVTGAIPNQGMTEALTVDYKTGELLARHRLNRSSVTTDSRTYFNRTIALMKGGAIFASLEGSFLTVLELAK